jgi:hypothetical protein
MKEERTEININCTIINLIRQMSEGNIGAATTLSKIAGGFNNGRMRILDLDDMNIRGTQVWIGFADHCNYNLERFVECIRNRDPVMVETINQEGLRGNHNWRAVTRGASFGKTRPKLR